MSENCCLEPGDAATIHSELMSKPKQWLVREVLFQNDERRKLAVKNKKLNDIIDHVEKNGWM